MLNKYNMKNLVKSILFFFFHKTTSNHFFLKNNILVTTFEHFEFLVEVKLLMGHLFALSVILHPKVVMLDVNEP